MHHEDVIVDVVARLLLDQDQIAVLDLRLHTIAFGSDEEAFVDVLDAEHRDGRRYLLLGVFVHDGFPFVSALSESVDRELDDIVQIVRDAFPDQSVSMFIFDEISLQYQLVQFVQHRLRVACADIVRYLSQRDSFLVRILLEESDEGSLDVVEFFHDDKVRK